MSRGYWPHGTIALEGVLQRLDDGAESRDWLTALGPKGEPLTPVEGSPDSRFGRGR